MGIEQVLIAIVLTVHSFTVCSWTKYPDESSPQLATRKLQMSSAHNRFLKHHAHQLVIQLDDLLVVPRVPGRGGAIIDVPQPNDHATVTTSSDRLIPRRLRLHRRPTYSTYSHQPTRKHHHHELWTQSSCSAQRRTIIINDCQTTGTQLDPTGRGAISHLLVTHQPPT